MTDQCCPPVLAQEAGHWQRYAGHWSKVAMPLCPHADDLSVYARELDARVPTASPAALPTRVPKSSSVRTARPPPPEMPDLF